MKPALVTLFLISLPFFIFSQNRYDVIIDEIMADPAPAVGLPGNEWVELKNTSALAINLQGWHIGDATVQSGAFPNFILQPDSFVVVCTGTAMANMSLFGTTISVTSFPSLDNDADQLFLRAADGSIIHAVAYSSLWYKNELKKNGGWTLEMVDTKSPCAGSGNWKASIDPKGGTPGRKNSVDAINNDQDPPKLKYAYAIDSVTIIAVFDEPLDSLNAASASNYNFDGGLSVTSAIAIAPLFNSVQLKLNSGLSENIVYHLSVNNVSDCTIMLLLLQTLQELDCLLKLQPQISLSMKFFIILNQTVTITLSFITTAKRFSMLRDCLRPTGAVVAASVPLIKFIQHRFIFFPEIIS